MRPRLSACLALLLPTPALLGCGDEPPTYPPIVVIVGNGVGTGGSGTQGPGGGNNTGNTSNQGGEGNGGPDDLLFPHCDDPWTGEDPPVETACDLDALEDGGELTGDVDADRTLESGKFYTLKGSTRVNPGVTLTIEPCVKVIGENADAVLMVRAGDLGRPNESCIWEPEDGDKPGPGGRLVAVGEPMAPIIFTSSKPAGSREPGDWGGLMINGNARNGAMEVGGKARRIAEGLERSECHGWDTDEFNEESSGALEYVRIEYASRQLGQNNETNGFTLNSVGSGTKLSHVMVSNSADDCFEWFGGTVNGDHLIALNCDDDMFDIDEGHTGQLQFLFGRQFLTTTETDSSGFEISNGPLRGSSAPFTKTTISNVTLCGGGPDDLSMGRSGVVSNQSSQPSLVNLLVTGFATAGMSVDSQGAPAFSYAWIWDNPIGNGKVSTAPTPPEGFSAGEGNNVESPDRFCDCWANPPQAVMAAPISGATPEGVDAGATYVGAFGTNGPESNWMRGLWADFSDK